MSIADYDKISVLLIWTAVALYALAFLVYGLDLSRRAQFAVDRKDARERELVAAGGGAVLAPSADEASPARPVRNLYARIGTSMVWLGFVFHLAATLVRGFAAGRVPWSNNFEFAMTGTLLMAAVYLAVLFRYDMRYLVVITGIDSLDAATRSAVATQLRAATAHAARGGYPLTVVASARFSQDTVHAVLADGARPDVQSLQLESREVMA